MSLLDPATLGHLLDGLGIAPGLLKPIPGLLGSIVDVVHGVTDTVGGITAGLGLPLPSLTLSGLGKILVVTPTTFTDASSGYLDNQSKDLYSGDALNGAVSTNSTPQFPKDSRKRSTSKSAFSNTNSVDTAFSSASSTCDVEPYQPEAVTATLPAPNVTLSTIYRYRRQQSVNLGSLFVLESWMVPSLFACAAQPAVSELDVANGWGGSARALLERHWDTWITEEDFKWMASIGVNTVRLPLGYWHLPTEHTTGTAYESVSHIYEGAWPRVIRTVSMAADHGIGVLIDLHGAPGSQNGQHHSGVSDGQTTLFSVPSNMDKAIDALTFLTKTFVNVPNVVGIQILNEPNNVPELLSFYNRALDTLRSVTPDAERFPFYVHDAFDMRRGTDYVESRSDWVILDHHAYYVFTPSDMSMAASEHITNVNGPIAEELKGSATRLNDNLVIGEWSCALTSDSLKAEPDPQGAQSTFCRTQMDVYSRAGGGWSFWSYKKENCEYDPSWCFSNAVGKTLPHTFYSYQSLQSLVTPGREVFDHAQSSRRSTSILSRLFRAHDVPPPLTKEQKRHKYERPNPSHSISLAQERVSQDVQMPPLPEILGKSDHPNADLPIGAVHPNALAPSVYHSPPVPMTQSQIYSFNKANAIGPMDDGHGKPVTPQAHRFAAIQRRREARRCLQAPSLCLAQVSTQLEPREEQPSFTSEERIMQRGYSDGFLTAKMFAQQGPAMSRLGFKAQYAKDTVVLLKGMGEIGDGDESKYQEWFWKGLSDGEGLVEKVIASMTSPT